MEVVTESALRILLRRRHLHGAQGIATRSLIHQSIDQLRRCRRRSGPQACGCRGVSECLQ